MARSKYLYSDRASAEAAARSIREESERRMMMLARSADHTTLHAFESEEGETVTIETRIWLRPRSGFCWFVCQWASGGYIDGADLQNYASDFNRRGRDSDFGRNLGDALENASRVASKLLFGENVVN